MARRSADAAVATPTVVASIWSELPDDVLLRIFDILVEERFNYDGQQEELEDLCAVRATTTQWLRAAKRTQFWLRTWCTVRESAAWPLRHCVLQLEIQTSNYPFPRPADDEYLETVAIEVSFMSRDIGSWHAVAGSDGWGVVEKARVEGEMLRRYSVVTYARIYHKKTGRACDIQTKEEEPMQSVEFESDGRRRGRIGGTCTEMRWCVSREGNCFQNARFLEYVLGALREQLGDDDAALDAFEAAAEEVMMEQRGLTMPLHRLEFCLRLDRHMHINSEAEYDPPRHVQALNPLPFGLHFSIDSVYPGRRSEFPWPNIWPVFYGYSLITDIQFAAIPVLLGEPATKYPPVMLHRWQQEAELRKEADAAALESWLNTGWCRPAVRDKA